MRVLYVDDEPSLCRAFVRMFVNEGDVAVTTSTSALEASSLIESEVFDVIVSDLRMPAMDGIEFLSIARAKLPDARRLLVSGYADLDSAISAINRVGVDRLLTKPWNTGELLTAIRSAAEHARLLRENAQMTDGAAPEERRASRDEPRAGSSGGGTHRQLAQRSGLGPGPAGLGDAVAFAPGGAVRPPAGP